MRGKAAEVAQKPVIFNRRPGLPGLARLKVLQAWHALWALPLLIGLVGAEPADARRRKKKSKPPALAETEADVDSEAADDAGKSAGRTKAESHGGDGSRFGIPVLTGQEDQDLKARVRQGLFFVYAPFLARPSAYRGELSDPIPNGTPDWAYHRPGTRAQLQSRHRAVDAKSRRHAGMPDNRLIALLAQKEDFRPEHLRPLLEKGPHLDDVIVRVHRVQSLGEDWIRADFDIVTKVGVQSTKTEFRALDFQLSGGDLVLPMRVIFDLPEFNPSPRALLLKDRLIRVVLDHVALVEDAHAP
jgi:hypothetical protein